MKNLSNNLFGYLIVGFVIFCFLPEPTKNSVLRKIESVFNLESNILSIPKTVGGGSNSDENKEPVDFSVNHSQESIDYFNEITLGSEFDGKRETPFKRDFDVKIYIDGEKPQYLVDELNKIVGELNDLINPIQFTIVNSKSQANTFVYFGSDQSFANRYPEINEERLVENWGLFQTFTDHADIFVDLYRTTDPEAHKHLLREELTQSLGLFNDSYKYSESIFYQGWTTTTEFAEIDKELIDMLYNN
jgi:hypothetical protein